MDQHLLSMILFLPLAGLAVLLFIPAKSKDLIRLWANLVSFGGLMISLPLVKQFQVGRPGYQFEESMDWIPSLGAHYHIGIDGISLLLVMLTSVMGCVAVLCSWSAVQDRLKEYYAMFLLLQTGMIGVFLALDFFLFYVFWELVRCRCTSSSACGAARGNSTQPSNSFCIRWQAACSCCWAS